MKNNKYNELIDKLLDATSEGMKKWDITSQSNEFQTMVGNISVLIVGPRRSLGFNANLDMESMSIALVNENGVEIDRQRVEKTDESYERFLELFEKARLNYYKVDDVLDKIISEL